MPDQSAAPLPVTVIVLAAQRTGVVNPLAKRAGVSHKCLVPICGKPLISHVMESLTTLPAVKAIRVVLEPDGQASVGPLLDGFRDRGTPIELIDSDANIVESVLAAAKGEAGPFVITTADNVLVTPAAIEQVREAMRRADAVIAVTTRERIWAVHPQGQRGFYEFRDGAYANCNLYGLANARGLKSADVFRGGGQFMASKARMINAFGIFNIALMMLKLVSFADGLKRVGKRFGATLVPVLLEDGGLAIDVDNERTYAIAEWILGQRLGLDIPNPDIPADMA